MSMKPCSASTVAECQILFRERVADEKSIEAAFHITNIRNITGEVPTGGREQTGLTDLASQLIPDTVLTRCCDQL